jgi:two-component system chemotaxis response regulator CheB
LQLARGVAQRDLIVIGASAGGVEALTRLFSALPADLPAAVVVAIHTARNPPSQLAAILARAGKLEVSEIRDHERLRRGGLYLAPPDHHLLVRGEYVRVTRGARENLHRPSIDVLFRSAALARGTAVIGVVLTGELDDGTAGLSAIKRCGGVAVTQAPQDASHSSMPRSALRHVHVDHCVPLAELAALLDRLVREPIPDQPPAAAPPAIRAEDQMAEMDRSNKPLLDEVGERTALTCPECHGVLWEIKDAEVPRFRCHVGHAYSPETMLETHSVRLEEALWAAVRSFGESADLASRLAARAEHQGQPEVVGRFTQRSERARRHANTLRELIESLPVTEPAF